jgi:hypothetical protein
VPDELRLASDHRRQLAKVIAGRLDAKCRGPINRRELAQRISVSERAIVGFVARGVLPAGHLLGGIRRWDESPTPRPVLWPTLRRHHGAIWSVIAKPLSHAG